MRVRVADVHLGCLAEGQFYTVPEELARQWIKAGYAEDAQQARMRQTFEENRRKIEQSRRQREYANLTKLLRQLGIVLKVEADPCAYCDPPRVSLHFRGETIYRQQGNLDSRRLTPIAEEG